MDTLQDFTVWSLGCVPSEIEARKHRAKILPTRYYPLQPPQAPEHKNAILGTRNSGTYGTVIMARRVIENHVADKECCVGS